MSTALKFYRSPVSLLFQVDAAAVFVQTNVSSSCCFCFFTGLHFSCGKNLGFLYKNLDSLPDWSRVLLRTVLAFKNFSYVLWKELKKHLFIHKHNHFTTKWTSRVEACEQQSSQYACNYICFGRSSESIQCLFACGVLQSLLEKTADFFY